MCKGGCGKTGVERVIPPIKLRVVAHHRFSIQYQLRISRLPEGCKCRAKMRMGLRIQLVSRDPPRILELNVDANPCGIDLREDKVHMWKHGQKLKLVPYRHRRYSDPLFREIQLSTHVTVTEK